MVRNAMFQKVQLAARDRFDELGRLETAAAALSDPPARVDDERRRVGGRARRLLGRARDDGRRARRARHRSC